MYKACTITLSFCCFAACVDVYGTHSNVHLRCFHTGKSTAIRAGPAMWKLPVSSSVIIISVIFIFVPCLWLAVWLQRDSCPFIAILSVLPEYEVICFWSYQRLHAHCHSNLLCLRDLFCSYSVAIFGTKITEITKIVFQMLKIQSYHKAQICRYVHVSVPMY